LLYLDLLEPTMPKLPRKRTVFFGALLIGASAVLLPAAWSARIDPAPASASASAGSAELAQRHRLTGDIWVSGQIEAADMVVAKSEGFRAVIALRPDGEVPEQPAADDMRRIADAQGLAFFYVPVPQGELADAVAEELGAALAQAQGPVLLYCRSGRRAVRAWAMAEAERDGGLKVPEILAAAAKAGHPVSDLSERLLQRVDGRTLPSRG
jgi:uncharacterized protein (TIGR01244 family)